MLNITAQGKTLGNRNPPHTAALKVLNNPTKKTPTKNTNTPTLTALEVLNITAQGKTLGNRNPPHTAALKVLNNPARGETPGKHNKI